MPDSKKHHGHRQRMFRRFLTGGFEGYRSHEILEQLLFEVLPRRNTNEIAHALLERFGTLSDVLSARREDLMKVRGVGRASADFLGSILPETGRMLLAQLCGRKPGEPLLLVTADFLLRVCAYESCAVLLDEAGAVAGFLGVGPDGAPRPIAGETTGNILPSAGTGSGTVPPRGKALSEESAPHGKPFFGEFPLSIVIEPERSRGRGAVRALLAEGGIGIARSLAFTDRLRLL